MSPELQTWTALGIVAVTAGLFLRRWLRRRNGCGCGTSCALRPPKRTGP